MKLLKPAWINHDGHPIFSIDIHPDDTHFATGGQGDDNTGRVVIWNLNAVFKIPGENNIPSLLCQLDHHSACVNCVRWSNSGQFLSSGGDDKVVIIWRLVSRCGGNSFGNSAFEKNNLEIWKTVSILRGHDGDILDLAWSPGDTYLASCSIDNTIRIWDAQNFPQVITTLKGHTSMVKGITWDPVGKYIASQSVDKTLRIWRTSDWTTEHEVKDPFVDCGGTTHVLRLGWSPDGLYLVSAHAMNYGFPTAQIIERDGWKVDKDFVGHRKAVVCVRFNKNIQEINRVKQCCVAIGSRDRSISVWSTALKRPVCVVKDAFSHSVLDLTWSHCGTMLLACSWDGSVMAAKFTCEEIGKPLSQKDTGALFQRVYGDTQLTNNSHNVIPNMEIYLARNLKSDQTKAEAFEQPIKPKQLEIIVPLPNNYSEDTSINKCGPSKQIETRTADGKRRITPKFLPLPSEDIVDHAIREDNNTVFKTTEGIASKKEENLRESMVSSIEDVSFGENNLKMTPKDVPPNCISTSKLTLPSNGLIPMEVDSPDKASVIVNGFGSSQPESENKSNSSPPAPVVNGVHTDSNAGNVVDSSDKSNKPVINGASNKDSNAETLANKEVKSSKEVDNCIIDQAKKPDQNPPQVNILQVKRKRPLEEVKPPPTALIKKKFTPQSLRNFAPKKSGEETPRAPETPVVPSNRTPVNLKSSCSSKSRLPQLKIDSSLAIQVNLKPEISYSLEVSNNYKRVDGICHQIKCQHIPTSMQGLEWTVCTDTPICAISGDLHRIVALCEDATSHVLDLKGRYAMSPFLLSGYPSRLLQSGPFLVVITVKGVLQMWNIHVKAIVIKSESLLPILNQPGGSDQDKAVDITNVYTAVGGVPVIYLSNGKSFIFNKDMCTWTLYADFMGLVSSPIMPDAGELANVLSQAKFISRRRKPEPAIISHIKLQLIKATELKKSSSIQQWLLVLGKTLATHGLEKELHILCEDLLGPTHSSAQIGSSWAPKISDCVDKRTMLREILNSLLEDLRWQDFFCEFDEQLNIVEGGDISST